MAKRHRTSFLLGISAFLIFASANGFACFCGGRSYKSTMRETVAAYSAGATQVIFEGSVEKQELRSGSPDAPNTALSMSTFGSHRVVTFNVLRAYRGNASGSVTVLTGLGGGDCGFDFETGKKYLVYASRVNTEILFTSICTGTSSLEQAGPAFRLLRGETPTPDDLLDPQSYYEKFQDQWYGTACGRVARPDGSPLSVASVDLTQVRDEPFPPKSASDPDMSKPDGSFCISGISPGKYVLTAETMDFDHDLRWMGYYPGVSKHADATVIEVKAGAKLRNLDFTVRKESLYTVSFRIQSSDGTPVPLDNLRVRIDSPDRDELAYHLDQHESDGEYTMGYVPPGHYVVRTYIQMDDSQQKVPVELTKWRMANQEVDIKSDADIVLKLDRAN
jgi:hypothetical protein